MSSRGWELGVKEESVVQCTCASRDGVDIVKKNGQHSTMEIVLKITEASTTDASRIVGLKIDAPGKPRCRKAKPPSAKSSGPSSHHLFVCHLNYKPHPHNKLASPARTGHPETQAHKSM
jgi:hypothetical protein